jgi:hypothetical protein
MTRFSVVDIAERAAARAACPIQATCARDLYFALMDNPAEALDAARAFLGARIEEARAEPADLPEAAWQLQGWIESRERGSRAGLCGCAHIRPAHHRRALHRGIGLPRARRRRQGRGGVAATAGPRRR